MREEGERLRLRLRECAPRSGRRCGKSAERRRRRRRRRESGRARQPPTQLVLVLDWTRVETWM